MKVFISVPMRGKTEQEIDGMRRDAMDTIVNILRGGVEFINNRFAEKVSSVDDNQIAIVYLARSIEAMAEADVAYFCKGWKNARGCRIEHEIAENYGITIIEE